MAPPAPAPARAPGPQLVHKQFNSPLGLYSAQNVRDTLGKHLTHLDNGAIGIDWSAPGAEQPANLANSAVLRLLQEQEQHRATGQKKVVWPPTAPTAPTADTNGYLSPGPKQHEPSAYQPPYRGQAAPPFRQQPPPDPYQHQPQSAVCEGRRQETCGLSKLIPVGPGVTAAPSPRSPRAPAAGRWAPVPAPASPKVHAYSQPSSQQAAYGAGGPPLGYSEQTYEEYHQSYGAPAPAPAPAAPSWARSPPPATISLRAAQPVHQLPPPVYASQPTTQAFQGGVRGRGDAKWPPAAVREAVQAENEARRLLARGPACRPRKVKKDYSSFFAAHALNHNHGGYRAPPGTQHFDDLSGRSSY